MNDTTKTQTIEQLRQRYNLDGLVNDRKAIQNATTGLVKVNTEQDKIIRSIILSMSGLESQSDMSLWFFSGIPSIDELPASEWTEYADHLGDLYYNRDTGWVYKFIVTGEVYSWERTLDEDIIQAMALTNASIDTEDSQRTVFFNTPTPPYSNGDWYLTTEGLYICQLSKPSGEIYKSTDFIIATKYVVGTQASEINGKIQVVAGQVTTIIRDVTEISQTVEDNRYYLDSEGQQQLISTKVGELVISTDAITSSVTEIDNSINGTEILDDNLIVLTDDTTTVSGMTITISNNTVTLNGTATSNISYDLNQDLVLASGQYSVDGLPSALNLVITDTSSNELYNDGNDNFELTEEETTDNIKIYIPTGTTYTDETFVPSLAKVINDSGIIESLNDIKNAISELNSTMLTQTSTAFEMLFTKTGIQGAVDSIQKILGGNTTSLETLKQYIRFEGASITLGKSDSQATLVISNDRISFMNGSNESAYITGNQLYITDSTILNKLQVGYWETKPDSYGNLNTRFVGEN